MVDGSFGSPLKEGRASSDGKLFQWGNKRDGEQTDVGLSLHFIVECQSSVVREEKSISLNDFGKDKQTDEPKRERK